MSQSLLTPSWYGTPTKSHIDIHIHIIYNNIYNDGLAFVVVAFVECK